MTRTMKTLSTLLMATTVAAGPALAGTLGVDTGVKAKTGIEASGGAAGLDTSAGAKIGGTKTGLDAKAGMKADAGSDMGAATHGDIVSSIRANSKAVSDIDAMTEVQDVAVVHVDSAGNSSAQAIDNAVRDNQDKIGKLRASIDQNAALKSKLEAEGVTSDTVVAANTSADGKLTVYVR